MGGGDDHYWRHASQSHSQSQSSQASRKSVDLTELDRLRVLVKYEFETALTTDELIEALDACHNNTREAYHYLKAKRQQHMMVVMVHDSSTSSDAASAKRRQDDTHDVQLIENPSKRMKETAPPLSSSGAADSQQVQAQVQAPARSLRLNNSQDVDMSSPASSQQSQSYQQTNGNGNGMTALPNTQQQLQEEEEREVHIVLSQRNVPVTTASQEAEMEEKSQEQSDMEVVVEGTAVAASPAKARQLLDDAIEDRRQNRIMNDNVSWISSVWDVLYVSSNLEIAQQLDLTCDALASWLKEFDQQEVEVHKRVGLELVLEIISKLPRADNLCELSQRVNSAMQQNQEANHVEVAMIQSLLQNPGAHQNAHARSVAAKNAITRITEECSSCLERIAWFKNAQKANVEHQSGVRHHIQNLQERLSKMVEQCSAEVRTGDSAVQDARQMEEMRSLQLREFVIKRRDELLVSGKSKVSAKLQAHFDVLNSDELEVAALLQSRVESSAKIQQCVRSMQKSKKEFALYQSAANLFQKVSERREWSLQNALKNFEDSRFASDQHATAALLRFIPILTAALQQYYEFHSIRQARAKEEAKEQELKLEEHIEYFGDSAPIKKEDLEKRIREFVGVISRSMQMMLQIADSQSRLWEGKKDVLPREVHNMLVFEYGKLWKLLSGPVRDVMQSFVAKMQIGSDVGSVSTGIQSEEQQQFNGSAPTASTVVHESPQRVASNRNSLSPATMAQNGLSGVKSNTPSMHSSPMRVEPMSMTQEVNAFLGLTNDPMDAQSTKNNYTSVAEAVPVTSPPKAPAIQPAVPVSVAPVAPAVVATPTPAPAAPVVHEYPVGTILYTKFDVGKDVVQFSRGKVDKLLEDGTYSVVYDDGDVFTVPRAFLFTEQEMQQDLKLRERNRDKDAAMADANGEEASGDGNCVIM